MAISSELERYRGISPLGTGGMATVTLARDTLLGREVALKRLTGVGDLRNTSRLRREALVGASINHPNLVSIYDVITPADGGVVIVMEYVAGETLRDRLSREGPLPAPEALRILEGAAAGLDAIHRQHIVHRDVKPANILLGRDGAVKLADLGIAAVPDRTQITTAGTLLGSLAYMAPEQLDDAPASPAVDIYALGAVAFEALSGRKARQETHPLAVAHAIATRSPPDLRKAWPGAPAAAAAVLRTAMARHPRRRPRSAGELVSRLGRALPPQPARRGAAPPARPLAARATGLAAAPRARPLAARATGTRPAAARAPRTEVAPAHPRRSEPAAGRTTSRRRWAAIAAPLAAAAALVAALVLVNRPSSGHATAHSNAAGGQAAKTAVRRPASRAATTGRSPSAAGSPAGTSSGATTGSGSATGSGPATGAATGSTGTGGSAATGSSGAGAGGTVVGSASGGSATPAGAVESFYTLAAAHDYAAAWALADPALRTQLDGYGSFQSQMAGDRSITFHSARVLSQSSSAATVAINTTSVRVDGTQYCSGTADVAGGGSGWRLHHIDIACR